MFIVNVSSGYRRFYCDTMETAKELVYRYLITENKEETLEEYLEKIFDSVAYEKNYTERPKSFKEFLFNIINDSDWLEEYQIDIREESNKEIITMENIDDKTANSHWIIS